MSYRKKEQARLPPQSVYFPCFTNETFWVSATENDSVKADKTQIVLDCADLKIGYNLIEIGVIEDQNLMLKIAKVKKDPMWWDFKFSDEN